jgi:LacI family transcriptional regulator
MFLKTTKRQKVTIKDIARQCNVSTQTVSRVINKRLDVSPSTRKAIETAISDLGYYPSAVARSLVRQKSGTLGLIIGGMRYLGMAQVLNGITEACEEANYALIIKNLSKIYTPNFLPIIETLMEHQVEGILFAAPDVNENTRTAQSQLPVHCPPIIFLKCEPNTKFTSISIDNYGGAFKAAEYLISIGRHHIGLIAGPLDWLESRQRKKGWEDALSQNRLELSPRYWSQGNWSPTSGKDAFIELIQKYPEMDALFISNDQMALGAMQYAGSHGIRIPDDIAVIGFDNLSESEFFSPPLTTIIHPLHELGKIAVTKLLDKIQDDLASTENQNIVLPTSLIFRKSTPTIDQ